MCCNQRNKSVENGVINNNSNSPSVSSPPSPATPSSTSHQSTHTISIDKAKELAKCMHETLWDTANTSQRRLTSLVSSRFRLGSSNPVESRLTTATTTTTTPVYVLRAWLRFSDIPVETIIGPQLESAKNSLQHSGTILSSVKNYQERWQAATCPEQVQQIIDDLLCETDENKAKVIHNFMTLIIIIII
ncbi:unnamed protein product [Trichobilharzia regenti]|nr:unnamed protein product [Trichobilharzia regenti]